MTNLRNAAKIALSLAALATTAAFAQTATSATDATVNSTNTLTVSTGESTSAISFGNVAPESTTTVESTVLTYDTNDGSAHDITANASLWTFESGAPAAEAVVPSLTVSAATLQTTSSTSTTEGTAQSGAVLIATDQSTPGGNVATGINNSAGTLAISLDLHVQQNVTAGAYATSITYTLTGF